MMRIVERCTCGTHLSMWEDGGRWHVACYDRCYDPAEDAGPIASLLGRGETPEDALEDFLRLREDGDIEPVYAPTSLASFVVPSHEGTLRVLTEHFDTLAEAEVFAEAFTTTSGRPSVAFGPSPIFFEPTPIQKAANQ